MGRVVLVTGAGAGLGAQVARRLASEPGVDRVVGVDLRPPRDGLAGVAFVRADIRTPVIGTVVAAEQVDTVVHLDAAGAARAGASASGKESRVLGTLQLLGACQRASGVRKLVLESATAVYGSSPQDPAMFTEDMTARGSLRGGLAKDAAEVEGYVRGFCRRRPDVLVTTLRLAGVLSARIDTAMSRYLRLPFLPTVLGFDPRFQLLHPDDAEAVLHRATVRDLPGTYNVAGDGVLLLSQAVRRTGTPSIAVPSVAFASVARTLGRAVGTDVGDDVAELLTHGRGVDTAALQTSFGHRLTWSTAATLDAFVADRGPGPLLIPRLRSLAERVGAVRGGAERG